jgi:hypothetical protein
VDTPALIGLRKVDTLPDRILKEGSVLLQEWIFHIKPSLHPNSRSRRPVSRKYNGDS